MMIKDVLDDIIMASIDIIYSIFWNIFAVAQDGHIGTPYYSRETFALLAYILVIKCTDKQHFGFQWSYQDCAPHSWNNSCLKSAIFSIRSLTYNAETFRLTYFSFLRELYLGLFPQNEGVFISKFHQKSLLLSTSSPPVVSFSI